VEAAVAGASRRRVPPRANPTCHEVVARSPPDDEVDRIVAKALAVHAGAGLATGVRRSRRATPAVGTKQVTYLPIRRSPVAPAGRAARRVQHPLEARRESRSCADRDCLRWR